MPAGSHRLLEPASLFHIPHQLILPDIPAEETFTPCVCYTPQPLDLLFPSLPGIKELITSKVGDNLMDKGKIKNTG